MYFHLQYSIIQQNLYIESVIIYTHIFYIYYKLKYSHSINLTTIILPTHADMHARSH